jgi:tetratricopeptide (TPR) repeat protein
MPAAASLYASAARLLPADDPQRLAFLPELGNAFIEIGRMDDADRVFAEAIDEGTRRDDLRVVADALLYRFEAEVWRGMMDEANESVTLARQLIPQAEATGDDLVQQRCWSILGMWAPSWAEQEEFTQRAMRFAERAGDMKGRNENIQMASGLLQMGPMPVEDALRVSEDYLERTTGDRVMEAAIIVNARAPLLARGGRMTDARAEYERARTTFRELGLPLWLAASGTIGPSIAELAAGDPAIALEMTEEAIARLEHINARGNWLVDVLQLSAHALIGLGRTREAGVALARLEMLARPTDPLLLWVRGSFALAEGRTREAIAEMRAALEEADDEWLPARGGITLDLAQALRADGNDDEARQAATRALEIFERKGDVVSVARARAFLESR